jgi:hypothetical protein
MGLPLAALLFSALLSWPALGEETFTLAILPDVQMETSGTRFKDRLTWLVENRSALNLKLMMQCGDMMMQCYHDNVNNPTLLLRIDTKNGTLKSWVFSPSNNETKADGSSRTITGIHWVQPATAPASATPAPPPP